MTARLIDGKALASQIRQQVKDEVDRMTASGKMPPGLGVLLIGENPASRSYVTMKEKACKEAGIYSEEYALPSDVPETRVLSLIAEFNGNPKIHGILVQLPIPGHLDTEKVLNAISPEKDVDGFHPVSVGRLWTGSPVFVP